MLNKGPFIVDAVKVLDDVLRSMQRQQTKKASLLRPLTIAHFTPLTASKPSQNLVFSSSGTGGGRSFRRFPQPLAHVYGCTTICV